MHPKTFLCTFCFCFFCTCLNAQPTERPDTAAWIKHIQNAIDFQQNQDYTAAVEYARQAMDFAAQWGNDYPEYAAQSANILGGCLVLSDRLNDALPLLRQAEQIAVREGLLHTETYLSTLSWLSTFYYYSSQFEEQVRVSKDLLERCRQTPEWQQEYEIQAINILAAAYIRLKQYHDAGEILEQAYRELKRNPDADDFMLPAVVSNLAYVYKQTAQYDKAFPLYREGLQLQEERFGRYTDNYARMLNNLAKLYMALEDNDAALPLLQDALQVLEKTIGTAHEEYRIQLDNLAYLYSKMDRFEEETACYARILDGIQQSVLQYSGAFSEKEQTGVLTHARYYYSRIHHKAVRSPGDTLAARLCFDGGLLLRGLQLRNSQRLVAALAETGSEELKGRLVEWRRLQREIYATYLTDSGEEESQRLDSLLHLANEAESNLAYHADAEKHALRLVTWRDVQQALGLQEAAVEFSLEDVSVVKDQPYFIYTASIVRPGWSAPRMVVLGAAAQVDSLLQHPGVRGLRYTESIYNAGGNAGHPLFHLLWAPMDSLLEGVGTVYFAPEGVLHQLNPEAWAVNKQLRLGDRYRLRRMSSTRQLADHSTVAAGPKTAFVIGGVQYDSNPNTPATRIAARTAPADVGVRASGWSFLPHSEKEAREVKSFLEQNHYAVELLSGAQATEAAFKSLSVHLHSPRIIHLASHGYFAPLSSSGTDVSRFTTAAHPLLRSGIILSGANPAWAGTSGRTETEDGVLTAYEISQCHFNNTELVVLSACNTGLGDIRSFEGVYGLQRAFKMAGAQYIIMSLWPAPDGPTRELMQAFYRSWMEEGRSIPDAFRRAVAEQRGRYPHPYYWAGFVLLE